MIARALVPVDGSALSEAALSMTREILGDGPREVELLRVVPVLARSGAALATAGGADVWTGWVGLEEEDRQAAGAYLESLSAQLPDQWRVRRSVRVGDAAGEIVARAAGGAFDLIVMSTHGRAGIGRWVMGSVAESVIHRTAVPVLLVHPARAGGPGVVDATPAKSAPA